MNIDRESYIVLRFIYRQEGKIATFANLKKRFPSGNIFAVLGVLESAGAVGFDFVYSNTRVRHKLIPEDGRVWCTVAGRKYVEDKSSHWWVEFRAWITLAIALVALVLSIIDFCFHHLPI